MMVNVWQIVAAVYLILCLLLGGASAAGAAANAFLQVLGLVLVVALLWRRWRAPLPREARGLVWIVTGFVALVLLSLVPLPPSAWQALPLRSEIARSLALIGVHDAWIPLSLAPYSSIASLLSLLAPMAIFLLTVQLPPDARRLLPAAFLVVALLSIALGVFQLVGGSHSSLRFYAITNRDAPVGFFANRNHQATLLLCALPLAGFLAARLVSRRGGRTKRSGGAIISIAVSIFVILGLALLGSQAGYGLFLPTALASILIYRRAAVGRVTPRWMAALGALFILFLGLALAGPLNQESLSGKFSEFPSSRRVIAGTTLEAISDSMPWGTGLGTFVNVYRRYEHPDRAGREYVNHAHNDYLEVALELGVPGILLIAAFLIWWIGRSLYVWRNEFSGAGLARAGSVMIGIILLHSIVDYPLRTTAVAAIFAMSCAFLVSFTPPSKGMRQKVAPSQREDLRHLEAD